MQQNKDGRQMRQVTLAEMRKMSAGASCFCKRSEIHTQQPEKIHGEQVKVVEKGFWLWRRVSTCC